MYWLIGVLVVVILTLILLLFLMYVAQECNEGVVITHSNEYQKLLSKYEHILTQAGAAGFEVKLSYSDTCYIEFIKKEEE